MTADSTTNLREENTFQAPVDNLPRLLRSSVMYGANGSGKSNIISAILFMQEFVLTSSKGRQEGDLIERTPFFLNTEGPKQPSVFEVFFIQDEVRYQYGFACTGTRVTHEWLLAYPEKRPQRWFERSYDPSSDKETWYFGSKFTGQKKTWKDHTRSNALFLSTAVQLNSQQLKPAFNWFKSLAVITHGQLIFPSYTAENCVEKETRKKIIDFLKSADINVDSIDVEKRQLSAKEIKLPEDMPPDIQNIIKKDLEGETIWKIKMGHKMVDSEDLANLPLEEESDGTQKLFAYAGPWLDVTENGRVFIVDELDSSFHPLLVRFLLQQIHNSETNKANGQLIFSTHDTSILDSNFLRRDQVYFLELDNNGSSQLYSLASFHPRKNEAFEKGYLQGRYGALPFIGEVNI